MNYCPTPPNSYILLSIKPKYLALIESGEKTVEIRKRVPEGKNTYFLVCKGLVHGYFYDDTRWASRLAITDIINQCKSCLTSEQLYKYATAADGGIYVYLFALDVKNYVKFKEPIPIHEFGVNGSPQNYCYARKVPDAFNQIPQ